MHAVQGQTELALRNARATHDDEPAVDGGRRFFELAHDMLVTVGFDGRCREANGAWARVLGWSEAELTCGSLAQLVHPDDLAGWAHAAGRLAGGGALDSFRTRCRTRAGEWRWLEWSGVGVPEDGCIYAAARDVTEKVKLELALRDSEARLREAQAIALVGSWEWDVIADRITWSDALYDVYGVEPGSSPITYTAFRRYLHPEDRDLLERAVRRALEEGEPYEVEHRIVRADGELRWVVARGRAVTASDGTVVRLVGTGQDITARKLTEFDLARSNAELEHFAHVASHDLLGPLRTVSSFLQLLDRRYRDQLPVEAHELIDFAREGAQRMHAQIHGLLDYSRSGGAAAEQTPVDTAAVVRAAILALAVPIRETFATIECGELPYVLADSDLLERVFQNLLSNAIKFRNGKPPLVRVTGSSANGMAQIAVSDNGIGIAPEHADAVFERFHRLHSDDEYEGTGLGLSICRRIVERHGGAIRIEQANPHGCRVILTLPLSSHV